jgi:hypothetical protein
MQEWSRQGIPLPAIQEWRRNVLDDDNRFHLTKLTIDKNQTQQGPYTSLSSETHLEQLKASPCSSLFEVLPRCRSLQTLELFHISSYRSIFSLSETLLRGPSFDSLSLGLDCTQSLTSLLCLLYDPSNFVVQLLLLWILLLLLKL